MEQQYQEGRAFTLFIGYGRLYALECNAGNYDMSQIDLIKARYWALRSEELRGESSAECLTYLAKFVTEDNLLVFINKWDKGSNNGVDPKYLEDPHH